LNNNFLSGFVPQTAVPQSALSNAKQNAEAKKKAFKRAIKDAQANGLIGVRELEGIQYVWLAKDEQREKGGQCPVCPFCPAT
jgi:hypothetical protein